MKVIYYIDLNSLVITLSRFERLVLCYSSGEAFSPLVYNVLIKKQYAIDATMRK